ncbi:MAG: serine/threonine-protein phosphatase [Ruminococcaceae bacterium]|nr:serine/threonine-protein phosphatase [Oscillospiraceae bacterium]
MKKIRASVCAVTHAGRIRKENEDNYDLNGRMTSTGDLKKGSAFVQSMSEPFHLAVCDGMGGESYGELASGIAVETIAAHASNVYESGEDFSFAIANCLEDANSRICAEINAKGKRMGTTLASIYAVKGKVYCVNIGDTRVYHYSKGLLEQISFDHTHAQTIVDAGEVSQDNIGQIPDAKRLTRHLGVFPEEGNLSPNISVVDDVDDGDVILLCSDGLTDMLDDGEITAILSTAESSQAAASKLIRRALENGGKDNVTVIAAFLNVEETAIFAPIAAAMVGDSDADYEDEYRNSFGTNEMPDDENEVSPYANADARIYDRSANKAKALKIAGIVVGAIALVVIAALLIKAFVGGNGSDDNTTSSGTTSYQNVATYPQYVPPTSGIETWPLESTSESTTEESTTEPTTKKPTTTKRPTTTKPVTTKRPTTTEAEETTTEAQSTTEAAGTTAEATSTTQAETTQAQTDPTTQSEQQPAGNEGESTAQQQEAPAQ